MGIRHKISRYLPTNGTVSGKDPHVCKSEQQPLSKKEELWRAIAPKGMWHLKCVPHQGFVAWF